ncbi:MAG: Zn-dependent oligopeptidase [Acidimicrobiia bacterium]|nr:Zn-dependent oligopeptidase [Acidimicrobiia bacterium]
MPFDYTSATGASIHATVDRAVSGGNQLIQEIVDLTGDRTFANTMQPLDSLAVLVGHAYGRGPFLGNVSTEEDIRNTAREAEERLSKWQVELEFRQDLYEAVREFSETEEARRLTPQQRRFLDFTMRDFRRAGHELGDEARAELKDHQDRLVELSVAFSKNLAEYEDYLIVTSADLDGLPDGYAAQLKPGDEEGSLKISMDYPDVVPFMESARRRDLREQLTFKFNTQAVESNRPILEEAVRIRERIAAIFDQPSWAHHSMEVKMAKRPEAVFEFYEGLIPPLSAKGGQERATMTALLQKDGYDDTLRGWDYRYYDTRLRKERYGVDPNEVAQYFPIEQVIEGMFAITGEVFGLDYQRIESPGAWHNDVTLYQVRDTASGELIAHFFADLFPRQGKYSHAAAFPLVPGHLSAGGGFETPVSAIVANFTKPTTGKPSLLQHNEVVTLFHEFGHILHMSLTRAEFVRFSAANTEWDFVEAPSQIMENWCWNAEVLGRFARHYQTGEPIPTHLVEQLVAARDLNVALTTLRQISFGWLDMGMHGPRDDRDLDAILTESQEITLFPPHEDTFFPSSFGHLMGGYDAGYYGYLWSEVFGDDMFSKFSEAGVTNPEVGRSYRKAVLEPNGSKDAAELLRDFLGREPSNAAFLAKLGISR